MKYAEWGLAGVKVAMKLTGCGYHCVFYHVSGQALPPPHPGLALQEGSPGQPVMATSRPSPTEGPKLAPRSHSGTCGVLGCQEGAAWIRRAHCIPGAASPCQRHTLSLNKAAFADVAGPHTLDRGPAGRSHIPAPRRILVDSTLPKHSLLTLRLVSPTMAT